MPPLHVTSEVGRLEAVLVHTPGAELEAVTPGTREDYLYDDIIDVDVAQREHRNFVSVLSQFCEVYQVADLLAEVLAIREARELVVSKTMDVVPSDVLAQALSAMPPEVIVKMLIEGVEEESGPIAGALNEAGYVFPPLPNLFFPAISGW